jgi:hypothetical protein
MTAPIDIECPACASTAGNYCTMPAANGARGPRVTFYHAERIDEAFRAGTKRQNDPRALRDALREALGRLEKRQDLDNADLSFLITTREVFGL